jgi:hypothetical protein
MSLSHMYVAVSGRNTNTALIVPIKYSWRMGRTGGISVCSLTRREVLSFEYDTILGRNVDRQGPGRPHNPLFAYYNRLVCSCESVNNTTCESIKLGLEKQWQKSILPSG